MRGWLLDSDYVIENIRRKRFVTPCFDELVNYAPTFISAISILEIEYGFARMGNKTQLQRTHLKSILNACSILDIHGIERLYGIVRLELKGQEIGSHDIIIATQALFWGLRLVTNNKKEFDRLERLETLGFDREKIF